MKQMEMASGFLFGCRVADRRMDIEFEFGRQKRSLQLVSDFFAKLKMIAFFQFVRMIVRRPYWHHNGLPVAVGR